MFPELPDRLILVLGIAATLAFLASRGPVAPSYAATASTTHHHSFKLASW